MVLLAALDQNYGLTGQGFSAKPLRGMLPGEADTHVWVRLASAISCLFADGEFRFSPEGFSQILVCHRWFASIFSATPFRNADHVIRAISLNGEEDLAKLEFAPRDLLKVVVLYSPESEVPLSLETLWQHSKVLAAGLCMVLVSARFAGSHAAHAKREAILPWLARKLPEVEDLAQLPTGVMHDVYMHCSYADRGDKHDVKRSINLLIQRSLRQEGVKPLSTPPPGESGRKSVMLVVVEWFTAAHSIYRTHSRTIDAAREQFETVGMGYGHCVDESGRKVFDQFVEVSAVASLVDQLRQICGVAKLMGAQVLYMPSVGMFPLTMWLANLRVAPLQAMGLGHPATSHAGEMDFVVVEEDCVGDPQCFSEKLLLLPSDGLPYRPSSLADKNDVQVVVRQKPDVVRIAVAATTMKLNPRFLTACAGIARAAASPVHFEFLIGQAQGLTYPQVQRVISEFVGGVATVHPHQAYAEYMRVISSSDLFINPFPFGNTNGIIDAVTTGLVGVCMTGPEVHEHIDQALFERLHFPAWLVTRTVNEYVAATVRLIDDHEGRTALRKHLAGAERVAKLFYGRPLIMGERLKAALASKLARAPLLKGKASGRQADH